MHSILALILGVTPSDMVLTAQVPGGPNPLWRNPLYQGEFIQCQSYHCDYTCSCGRDATSGGDRTDSSTQVPTVRHGWAPMAISCRARY
jgi:hypothetical protein